MESIKFNWKLLGIKYPTLYQQIQQRQNKKRININEIPKLVSKLFIK